MLPREKHSNNRTIAYDTLRNIQDSCSQAASDISLSVVEEIALAVESRLAAALVKPLVWASGVDWHLSGEYSILPPTWDTTYKLVLKRGGTTIDYFNDVESAKSRAAEHHQEFVLSAINLRPENTEITEDKTRLLELALGFECAAEAENCVVIGMQAYVEAFRKGPVDGETLRRLRVYNEAKSNMRQFEEDAAAIRNILKLV